MAESKVSPKDQVDGILQRMVASGRRRTMSRQAVVRVIVESHGHTTADGIATKVQEDFPSVDVSTVYRTLETLRELDIVDRVYFADGSAVYHLRDHQHHHLCCERCGAVQELPMSLLSGVERSLMDDFGFEMHRRPLGIFGICRSCREAP